MKIKPHKNYYICNQPNINSHSLMMKQLIACCGLDCESCDARIATVRDDNELREKTAQLWSELNLSLIHILTPEQGAVKHIDPRHE